MKKYLYLIALTALLLASVLAGCKSIPAGSDDGTATVRDPKTETAGTETETDKPSPEPKPTTVVSLSVKQSVFFLKDREVADFDFASCFTLTVNGEEVPIREEWLDHSLVKAEPGSYEVICTYLTHQATAKISVTKTNYLLTLLQKEISLTEETAKTYDFNTLFEAKRDGEIIAITSDMVQTDFRAEIGEYTYTVTNGNRSETLKIHVVDNRIVEIIPAYRSLSLTAEELRTLDPTGLFTVFIDGAQIPVTADMLTGEVPSEPQVGRIYTIGIRYSTEKQTYTAEIPITVSAADDILIRATDVETYPNAEPIDLTTLFTIQRDGQNISVTQDMISGSVDYTMEGENIITLTYRAAGIEKTATAIVTVKRGVVIRFAKADTVTVRRGTNPDTYQFADDFILLVNGIRFRDFPHSMLDLSEVDFETAGLYKATLTVRYNDGKVSFSGPNYQTYTATIYYRVVENTYSVNVRADVVVLPKRTASYDPFSNLIVLINGLRQTLTDDPSVELDAISCYARLLSGAIDFAGSAQQRVEIAVYVNGRDAEPVIVSYLLRVESDITVTAHDTAVFAGGTLSPSTLFTVTEGGKNVTVTYGMLSGTIDLSTPGIYRITLCYRDVEASATVAVLDRSMLGTYHTALRNITEADDEDEEGYVIAGTPSRQLDDLIIREDGTLRVDRTEGVILGGFGTERMTAKVGSQLYDIYFADGIVILNPDNSLKMTFTNSKRPMVYFHEDQWEITGNLTVNSLSSHVLQNTNSGYSYDLIRIRSKQDATRELWYALYIRLVSKNSADTVYDVRWGETDLDASFVAQTDAVGVFRMDGETVGFRMTNKTIARPYDADETPLWANCSFTGTVDGKSATLRAGSEEQFTLYIDGVRIFSGLRAKGLTNGVADYATGTLFLYNMTETAEMPMFSYLFRLNTEANTFEVVERDLYYGLYVCGDMTLFLDGYGTGLMAFSAKDYKPTSFAYTVRNSELKLTYRKTDSSFAYGTEATFTVAPFLNLLTVRRFTGMDLDGKAFVNTVITDGALVEIPTYTICDSSQMSGQAQLYELVRIVTRDGELSVEAKKACMNVTSLYFGSRNAAFCQFTVTVKVGGENVTAYYAVLIPCKLTGEATALVRNYGAGLVDPKNTLKLDEFGRVTYTVNGVVYTGFAEFREGGFYVRLLSNEGGVVTMSAKLLASGTVAVQTSGAVSGSEVFTASLSNAAASSDGYLRYVRPDDETLLFFFSESAGGIGRLVTAELLDGTDMLANGVTLLLKSGEEEVACLRVVEWGKTNGGIVLSDACRGTFAVEALNAKLILDGFGVGSLTRNTDGTVLPLTYRVNSDGSVTLLPNGKETLFVCKTDRASGTATVLWRGDNQSLISGKTYAGTYSFICGDAMYEATTTLYFDAGQVKILSSSESHDSGDERCLDDTYTPDAFCGIGTYTVRGDEITIVINGVTFEFRIRDVRYATQLVCTSTTLPTDTHGYFGTGVLFAA
ncbi:MAG TPA: hypothetical protein DDW30_05875 [Clostridiales bacterium]|nr:hypothetical protein [Clostridiales bacterium]